MEEKDKRYYTRYRIILEGRVFHEKGFILQVEVLDINIEGVRLRTDSVIPLLEEDKVDVVIKWKSPIKVKGEIKWIKENKPYIEFGVKFTEMDMANREALASLVSEYALSSLMNSHSV